MMRVLNWGEIPADLTIGDEPYRIGMNRSTEQLMVAATSTVIDSHLEAVRFTDLGVQGNHHVITIDDSKSMKTLIRRLLEADSTCDECEDSGADLASSIMGTLGYEWV